MAEETPDWLRVTYRVTADRDTIAGRAEALAVEQSIEMELDAVTDPWVRANVAGRVAAIGPDGAAPGRYLVSIALSALTIGDNPAQLLNMLFGNASLCDDVELLDIDLPDATMAAFSGPNLGMAGIRGLLDAPARALTCTALKPQGASAADLAELCRRFAAAGIDIVKDDHGLADQETAPFADRVRACQKAVLGTATRYAPSIVGPPRRMAAQLATAVAEGVQVVLTAPMLCGLATFQELTQGHRGVAFVAHPAFAGHGRIAPALLFGKLFRLFGADAVIFPNHGGRFAYSPAECAALADAARQPWQGLRPTLPVPAGGMPISRIHEMLGFYGDDVMLLISGALLTASDLDAEARRFVAAVRS
ncbi:MAG: S-methyl-5-thioribulose 1-phosphate isomerase [Acidimicrobiaceae bacterium]|jgi:ribulose-bisphosphate carboxylase large chain|nr:S-methyl-5-thioribulose 1-phosphate isomerase [Acidimicrobiaceae bacterium]